MTQGMRHPSVQGAAQITLTFSLDHPNSCVHLWHQPGLDSHCCKERALSCPASLAMHAARQMQGISKFEAHLTSVCLSLSLFCMQAHEGLSHDPAHLAPHCQEVLHAIQLAGLPQHTALQPTLSSCSDGAPPRMQVALMMLSEQPTGQK